MYCTYLCIIYSVFYLCMYGIYHLVCVLQSMECVLQSMGCVLQSMGCVLQSLCLCFTVYGMVPFLNAILGTMLPMLSMAKQDNMKWVFSSGKDSRKPLWFCCFHLVHENMSIVHIHNGFSVNKMMNCILYR